MSEMIPAANHLDARRMAVANSPSGVQEAFGFDLKVEISNAEWAIEQADLTLNGTNSFTELDYIEPLHRTWDGALFDECHALLSSPVLSQFAKEPR